MTAADKTYADEFMTVVATIGPVVQMCLGLDDYVLRREAYPSLESLGHNKFGITRMDLRILIDDVRERSLNDEAGFGHTPAERKALRWAAKQLKNSL